MAVAPSFAPLIPGGVHIPGDFKEFLFTLTVGAADTYVTGGFVVLPASVGVNSFAYVSPVIMATGHYGVWNYATGKLQVFSAAGTELANASAALQNTTFVFEGYGK